MFVLVPCNIRYIRLDQDRYRRFFHLLTWDSFPIALLLFAVHSSEHLIREAVDAVLPAIKNGKPPEAARP